VELNDQDGGIEVIVTGGSAPGYSLGAVLPAREFTAEGCLAEDDVCHTLGADGGFFEVDKDCEAPSDALSCIPEDYYRAGSMTFVLKPSIGSGCWVWGSETAYYDALSCEITGWDNESY
jgi:hypothetical protein